MKAAAENPFEPAEIPGATTKPKGVRELTPRALIAAAVVAAIMGASYPYIVLKLGFGPNVSVVAAFFGYLALGIAFRNFNRWENNIVQTAGTSASQTAFMCVLLAAFDMLRHSNVIDFAPSPFQSFIWLSTAGWLGVLLAVPMRQHFIVDEKLTFADGVAAAETLIVLDARGKEAQTAVRALVIGALLSGTLMFLQQGYVHALSVPETIWPTLFGVTFASMGAGVSVSLLNLGSGMLVGTRINSSMLLGTVISWVIAPHYLLGDGGALPADAGDVTPRTFVLRWVMWPATGMLVAGGLTALVVRWKVLMKTFKHFKGDSLKSEEFPIKWVGIGCCVLTVATVWVQRWMFDIPMWMTFIAVLASLPLMLVGLRVLGETNWGPISALSNMMQGIFAAVAPGHVAANMTASGTTGIIAANSEAILQDYKAGDIIGSSPKNLTYAQLMAVPIGAAAVAWMYPLLRDTYGLYEDVNHAHPLSSPISTKWAGFAEFLSKGLNALPPGALIALSIAVVLGVVFTLMEAKWPQFTPSPSGMGIGMLVPGSAIITMFIGGLIELVWTRSNKKSSDAMVTPLASGLIAGEAIVAVVVPLLILAKILPAP
jgi:uncharacterized oligopeptide transporter (OPT) family protein